MKKKRGMLALILMSTAAIVFAFAFFLGRASMQPLLIETQRPAPDSDDAAVRTWIDQTAQKAADAAEESSGKLCLNTASLEELLTLPGVGEKTAARILAYRDTYGRFITVEQLLDVDGIGQTMLDTLRAYVYVEESYENSGS